MVFRLVAVVALVVLAILVIAAFRSGTIQILRSRSIQAPPDKVFALIDDFHNWKQWAPQDVEDPAMKRTFSGSEHGLGAASEWSGSGNSGKGRMSIVESEPPKKIVIKVDFVKPFEAHNVNEFTLESVGAPTLVTWKMHGTNAYFMKVMGLFVNMDKMMGKHFERGLDNLKIVCEKQTGYPSQ
ncbi:MAG TPA: SRPBCC family protein [Terriglobales bacterium]